MGVLVQQTFIILLLFSKADVLPGEYELPSYSAPGPLASPQTSTSHQFNRDQYYSQTTADVLERSDRGIQAKGGELKTYGIFLSQNNSVVETHVGADVRLHCRITRDSDYGTISWFKNTTSLRLLTVGDETYIDDSRLNIVRPVLSMNWSLQLLGIVQSDEGVYICQSTTYPPSSIYVKLVVYEAYAEISGGKEKVFKAGSRMQLTCTIKDITKQPSYIFWYHNSRMINYDSTDGVSVAVSSLHTRSLISQLTIQWIRTSQAGNYSCSPSLVRPDTVLVRVEARGEGQPEPVLNSGSGRHKPGCPVARLLLTYLATLLFLQIRFSTDILMSFNLNIL